MKETNRLKTGIKKRLLAFFGNRKRNYFMAALAFLAICLTCYFSLDDKPKTIKYIAYIGRYRTNLDTFSEFAIRNYLLDLNNKHRNDSIEIHLKPYSNEDKPEKSDEIYKYIGRDSNILMVIDNTWGKDMQKAAGKIRELDIPVISLNANYNNNDFGNNAVFLGSDDEVPNVISNFLKNIANTDTVIFLAESDYPLSDFYRESFRSNNITVREEITVKQSDLVKNKVPDAAFEKFRSKLDTALKNAPDYSRYVFVVNMHAYWGEKVLKYIDDTRSGVRVISPIFGISNIKERKLFEKNNNILYIKSKPTDAISLKIATDLRKLQQHPASSLSAKAQSNPGFFLERCHDAVSIADYCLFGTTGGNGILCNRDSIVRRLRRFRNVSVKLDSEILLFDDKMARKADNFFSQYINGELYSIPFQLNPEYKRIPTLTYGIEIQKLHNVDELNNTFEADFKYWVKGNRQNIKMENAIHFSNMRFNESTITPLIQDTLSEEAYKLYNVSGKFSCDLNLVTYPFDTNIISIDLEILNPTNELLITFDQNGVSGGFANSNNFKITSYTVDTSFQTIENKKNIYAKKDNVMNAVNEKSFKQISFTVYIIRKITGPLIGFIIPVLLLGLSSVFLFFLRDRGFSNVGEVGVGLLLAIVTSSIPLLQLTPNIGVVKTIDKIYLLSLSTIFLNFILIIFMNSFTLPMLRFSRKTTVVFVAVYILVYLMMIFYIVYP